MRAGREMRVDRKSMLVYVWRKVKGVYVKMYDFANELKSWPLIGYR